MRFVVYVPKRRLVVAIDRLLAKDDTADFEQFWHLAPGTIIMPRTGGFIAVQQGHHTHLNIAVDSSAGDSWDQWEGGEGQPIGWTMTGWNQIVPNPVLRRSFSGTSRWCATTFRLTSDNEPFYSVEIEPIFRGAQAVIRGSTSQYFLRIQFEQSGDIEIDEA